MALTRVLPVPAGPDGVRSEVRESAIGKSHGSALCVQEGMTPSLSQLRFVVFSLCAAVVAQAAAALPRTPVERDWSPAAEFLGLVLAEEAEFEAGLQSVSERWQPSFFPFLIETARFCGLSRRASIFELLEKKSGETLGTDFEAAFRWVWSQEIAFHPEYAGFKAQLYRLIDPRFESYFDDFTDQARIRLDEIRWGGVKRDGIPPLRNPEMIPAKEATYLDDSNVVFGLEVDGEARAYPKRVLAWHEMFTDSVGDGKESVSVCGVYCTLCGSMIVYETEFAGVNHELGTSGFLYRSNKLMYDAATESLWSTLQGEPVVGPLVGSGIRLRTRPVLTTTWGEWRRRHPESTVLSLETGHSRDYGEGVAYRDYFATDELMFTVPKVDSRLPNKAEVLVLRFGSSSSSTVLAVDDLSNSSVYRGVVGDQPYVVLTDRSGAHRVYDGTGVDFESYDGSDVAVDRSGVEWRVKEDDLEGSAGVRRARLPTHRAFWFGWIAAFPDTDLVRP